MTQSVALIDYGSGNLRSAERALVRAADGKANIVVTHDPRLEAYADRIIHMEDGKILSDHMVDRSSQA